MYHLLTNDPNKWQQRSKKRIGVRNKKQCVVVNVVVANISWFQSYNERRGTGREMWSERDRDRERRKEKLVYTSSKCIPEFGYYNFVLSHAVAHFLSAFSLCMFVQRTDCSARVCFYQSKRWQTQNKNERAYRNTHTQRVT